jgi:NAD-dependent dihydropyrimidine dehydrogenase PreA subunit
MPFFIAGDCLDVLDKSCTEECPVDCIYEGDRKMYINPRECIDCGACEPVCPVSAVVSDLPAANQLNPWRADNAVFFNETLPGRDAPVGTPGGAAKVGRVGVDTPLAAAHTAG